MVMLRILLEVIVDVGGGLIGAIVLTGAFWSLFKLVRHPEWGPPFGILLLVALVHDRFDDNRVFPMLLLFSSVAAVFVWPEGRAWRRRRSEPAGRGAGQSSGSVRADRAMR